MKDHFKYHAQKAYPGTILKVIQAEYGLWD